MISIHVLYHKCIAIGYINNYNMLSIGSHESNAVLQWSCDACTCLTSHIFTYGYATKYIYTRQYLNTYIQYSTIQLCLNCIHMVVPLELLIYFAVNNDRGMKRR